MEECYSNALQAITPLTRMLLTLLQVQFIFLNHKVSFQFKVNTFSNLVSLTQDVELNRHKVIGRFGLMHMIATNLCEWLCVLIEETNHEIRHLSSKFLV